MRADSQTNAEIFSSSSIPKINKIPAQSPWSNPGDIEKWGWTITQDESKWIWSGFDWEDVRAPLETLGLSTEIKDWDFVQTQHTKAWEVDGVHGPAIDQEYAFPGAKYQNFWLGRDQDASKYTLVLMGMFSPAGMVNEKTPPPDPKPNLPQLAAWSDMVYLQWYWTLSSLWKKPGINLDGSSKIPCPKQIITTSVITDSTRRILDRVRKNLREEPEGVAWPGDSFHPDSQAGRAILGSVHGRSLAWFLIQHKQQFGNKVFTSIHLFRKNEWRKTDKYQPLDYELYFEIGDVDEQDAPGGAEIW
ncbi:hypothetical protein BLS_003773 [Venturia inaequalis]|nr:hypothetical protein BLS_003773 [Venturia inaequalis]